MNNQLTTEEMKAQGIAWLSWDAWRELESLIRIGEGWLAVWWQSFEELIQNQFVEDTEIFEDYRLCKPTQAGMDYYNRFREVYS